MTTMETDMDGILDVPSPAPLPTNTFGVCDQSDPDLPPARKAKVTPISTGKSLTDRFKELPRKPKPKTAGVGMVSNPAATPRRGDVNGATAAAYSRTIKSLRQYQTMHMQEMVSLQEERRRKRMESQQLRIGNTRIIGGKPSVHQRTGLICSINRLNTIVRNRSQAELSTQVRTAESLNLRLGVPRNSDSSNRSIMHFQKEDILKGPGFIKDRIGLRDIRRGTDQEGFLDRGISAAMTNRNSTGFYSNRTFTCKYDLDQELDEYMTKTRELRKKLDKELEDYMVAAAAARKNKSANVEGIPEGFAVENHAEVFDDVDKPDFNATAERSNDLQKEGASGNGSKDNNEELMDLDW